MKKDYDLLIIGGGINGTAIARDAAGRGLSVLLCERDDLANHTSSSSTKLIHGGLRYLEHFEFKLVREALIERERLLRAAPHIIWPMRFVLPYDKGLRPAWMLRMGLFLYDSLGGRELLPGTKTISLETAPHKGVLEPRLTKGFEYSDCWVEDARLVVLNAVDAAARGADICTRTEVLDLKPTADGYQAKVKDKTGARHINAHAIVNSAGPWVDEILGRISQKKNDKGLRLVKGSHIVTRKLFDGDHSYIFQNADNRIIFAIPYEGDHTLIGTTDVPFDHAPGPVKISPEETQYLCDAANEYFQNDISPEDVQWSYSGVRPLYDDKSDNASAVTRDYVLDIDEFTDGSPFLSIYGGKITTSRKLAQHAMQKLAPFFIKGRAKALGEDWTETAIFPGGDIANADFESFFRSCELRYPEIETPILWRLARGYGTRISLVLGSEGKLGKMFGAGLSESETRYLVGHEFVTRADDVMWRRSKLGLHMSEDERAVFTDWFDATFAA
jgi:glycerol-3-phosphate dehydrogenase